MVTITPVQTCPTEIQLFPVEALQSFPVETLSALDEDILGIYDMSVLLESLKFFDVDEIAPYDVMIQALMESK